jgi:hypothetical protein
MPEHNKEEHANGIKSSIETIIGTSTNLKKRKRTSIDQQRESFEKMIIELEKVNNRSELLGGEFGVDFTEYDTPFYSIIDSLLEMLYGKEAIELIFFYLYDRISPDGSTNGLFDEAGNSVKLETPSDLWFLVQKVQEEINKKKK